MTTEIRPVRDSEELAQYMRNMHYVFASLPGPEEDATTPAMEWTTAAIVDGKVATTLATLPFTVRLNGNPVKMGGVTQVGTLPAHRRTGLLRKVMTEALRTMKEREQPLAILWASMGAIYQRFGYGLATSSVRYAFDPRFAKFETHVETPGTVQLLYKDEAFPIIKQHYIEWAADKNLVIHRSTVLWQASTLSPIEKDRPVFCAIYRNAAGEVRGHAVYSTKEGKFSDPGPGQELQVNDFIWRDMDAYRALWEYLCSHDLVRRIEMNGVQEDDPAPELLLEPRMLQRRTSDGIWMRVVDAEKALAARPYGTRGELTIEVVGDDVCPWNTGTYLLETDGPSANVRRIDRIPDITVSPNVLASLLAGYRNATYFERADLLTPRDANALKTADALFRTEWAPYCPNGF
jgi:predicted acetyltransferase